MCSSKLRCYLYSFRRIDCCDRPRLL